MKKFSKIAIVISGLLFFIHSFIPHNHKKSNVSEIVASSSNEEELFGFLTLLIDFNLGNNHLENFLNNLSSDFDKNFLNSIKFFPVINFYSTDFSHQNLYTPSYSFFFSEIHVPILDTFQKTNFFRGPPTRFI